MVYRCIVLVEREGSCDGEAYGSSAMWPCSTWLCSEWWSIVATLRRFWLRLSAINSSLSASCSLLSDASSTWLSPGLYRNPPVTADAELIILRRRCSSSSISCFVKSKSLISLKKSVEGMQARAEGKDENDGGRASDGGASGADITAADASKLLVATDACDGETETTPTVFTLPETCWGTF